MFLNCHSYFSLRYGTLSVSELVRLGVKARADYMALTDINSATGAFEFYKECKEFGIHPIIGHEFRNDGILLYIGLAMNNEGFREMNEFLSNHFARKEALPGIAPAFENVFIIYPFELAPAVLKENEYIGIRIADRYKLRFSALMNRKNKLLILHPVTFKTPNEFGLHKVLRSIDNNVILTKLALEQLCRDDEQMVTQAGLLAKFEDFPFLIENTKRIAEQCQFEFEFGVFRNKETYTGTKYSDKLLLEQLVKDGFEYRYGKNNLQAWARAVKELEIIDHLGFGGYFLCTWDIVRYSLSRGLFHVGRGSGANSIVAYILKITNVCPMELDLYFERFLNPARMTPPDFDVDWSWEDRDDILDYIFKRFDAECTAFCGTVSEWKHRSLHREIGKVFGLPKEEIDQLSANPVAEHSPDSVVHHIHHYAAMLQSFPNQRSMHACGVLISEKPLTYYTALNMPPKGFRTAQFDMYTAEDIGFEKFDILSQRGLGTIRTCIDMVEESTGERIDFNDHDLYLDHPLCNDMLSRGRTLGCFYVESPAMRGLLRRLRANNYRILVAASSVIRPGVAKSGMLREFQRRHNHPNDFEYFHPVFEEHLGETYGVMVYQEDVIKIAHFFGGLDMADGDILRRGMSGKTRGKKELEQVKQRFFANCKEMGHSDEITAEVYRQIESFAGYSFCKSHSASYAVESYLAIYLKAHYPLEFMVSAINNFGGFYRSEVYFHEVKMAGGTVEPPCVNTSEQLTVLVGKTVFVGFGHLDGFNAEMAERIIQNRRQHGPFKSLEDFINRVPTGIEHLQVLIFVGAFRFTQQPKSVLILEGRMILGNKSVLPKETVLFEEPAKKFTFPTLEHSRVEDSFDEIELLGFPVTHTPFELLQTRDRGDTFVEGLLAKENQVIRIVGYLIARKPVPTAQGNMNFGTWIDEKGEFFDTAHFANCLIRYPFQGAGCYLIEAVVTVEFGFPSLIVNKLSKLPMVEDPRYEEVGAKTRLPNAPETIPGPLPRAPYPSRQEVNKLFQPGGGRKN